MAAKLALLRRVAAILFLFLFFVAFLDFFALTPPSVKKWLLQIQFVPSLLQFIATGSFLSFGFFVILLLTYFTGRLYCSAVCPLGILQDIIIRIKSTIRGRKHRYAPHKDYRFLRYSVLIVSALAVPAGAMLVINLLDPFSVAGKLTVAFLKPLLLLANNGISGALAAFRNYSVPPLEMKLQPLLSYIIPVAITGAIVWLAVAKERIYCNTFCPVGALLGLLSRYSRMRFFIDHNACKSCGVCAWVCKAGCIDTEAQTIDAERCVVCFNCIKACPTGVLLFNAGKIPEKKAPLVRSGRSTARRDFLVMLAGVVSFGFIQKKPVNVYRDNKVPVIRKNPVSPPGSISLERFKDKCTACQLCVSQCPTLVLQPSISDYGIDGIMQPVLNFRYAFCNYECTVCSDVCPTGALLPVPAEKKKLIQLGKAKFIKENCVVETQGTECGACSEHCPTKAVHMVPYKKLLLPEMRENICIGCGACEFACPTKPYKAIYVEGNPVHALAEKPAKEEKKQKVEIPEEFPF